MKKLNFKFLVWMTMAVMLVTSCRNGKKNPPIVTVTQSEYTVIGGETIMIDVNYERGDRQIKEFRVMGVNDEEIVITDNDDSNKYTYAAYVPWDASGSTITIVFTAMDTRKNESSAEVTINVETPFLRRATNGIVHNQMGPSNNAWDIEEGKKRSSLDADIDKDIADRTSPFTGAFSAGGWEARNETKFVIANDYDYDRASKETAKSAYAAGDEKTLLNNDDLAEGNIIIAKVRGSENYAVIQITEVYDDNKNGGTGNNADYRKFNYRF